MTDPRDLAAQLAGQYALPDPSVGELVDLAATALAALDDLDRALADATFIRRTAAGNHGLGPDHPSVVGLGVARRHMKYSRGELIQAAGWIETVGRNESRDRHPSRRGGRHE